MGRLLTPLDALSLGWSIVPCGLNKKPLVKWKEYPTRRPTEEEISQWQEELNPASWAIVNGELSNRVTLEYTKDEGARTAELLGLPLPHRRSPRGGGHVDCRWPGFRVKTLNDKACKELRERCPGLDIKGDGGYCIFLGKSSYGDYKWLLDSTDAYDLDPAIWAKILPPKPAKRAKAPTNGADKPDGSTKRVDVELLVRTALGKVAAGMGRNNAGAWLSIQLRDNNYTKDEALAVAFSERCPPYDANGDENPYTPEEWAATVESVFSQPAREPWSSPEETTPPPPLLLLSPVVLPPSEVIPFSDPAQTAVPPPAPEKVDIGTLLDKICTFTRRFVRMTDTQHRVNALWVVHTHVMEAAEFTPYIHVHSPMLRSGKTRLLEVDELVVREPLLTGGITVSALLRTVDKFRPTILLDEVDAIFNTNGDRTEALRAIINTGFARGGKYRMSVPWGKDWEPRDFSTFCPKMLAGIGKGLPTTVRDRSIPFELKRRLRSEPLERFRKRKEKLAADLMQQQLAQWARDNGVALGKAEPELPEELDDRRWDVIEPLLAIADMAEGEWPKQARAALVELCGAGSADSTEICIRLLADIKSIFGTADQLQTKVLLGSLMALSESPWREYNRNGPITAKQLAELLEDFGPHSRKIHVWEGAKRLTLRGYLRSDFQDAWERYPLPEEAEEENEESGPVSAEPAKSTIHPPHPPQPNVYAGPGDFPHPPHEGSGAGRKSEESPINTRGGARGADEIPNTQAEDDSADVEPWLTPEELAKYAGHDVPQEVSALPQDWTPTDADSLDEDEEAD